MKAPEAEVLVVGAGPAGAALGLELARRGRDVLILERSTFPRDKPCGDCVNPGAVAELDRLGVAARLRAALAPHALHGWRVEAPDGSAFQAGFGSRPDGGAELGWAVRRRDLDAALLDEARRAGARVRFGFRAFDLLREEGRVAGVVGREGTSLREARAAFVVGADGLRSVVRRRLGLEARPARLRKIALVGHLARRDGAGAFGELRVRAGRTCGYAPLGTGANVTLVIAQREAVEASGDPRRFLLAGLAEFPEVLERVRRCGMEPRVTVTGPFDYPVSRPWAPGVALVGDASGYYDPFTGQGIYQALRSARLAVEAIDRVLADPRLERRALKEFGRRMRREFAPTRRLQRVIEAAVSRPEVMARFIRALSSAGGTSASRLLRVTGDIDPASTLLDPLLWARLILRLG